MLDIKALNLTADTSYLICRHILELSMVLKNQATPIVLSMCSLNREIGYKSFSKFPKHLVYT